MVKKRAAAPSDPEAPSPDAVDSPGTGTASSPALRAARIARAIQQREEYLARGIAFLREMGVIDRAGEKRLWDLYHEGDVATRRLVMEQISRALTGATTPRPAPAGGAKRSETPADEALALDPPFEFETDPEPFHDEPEGGAAAPRLDAHAIAERVRGAGLGRFLGQTDDPGRVLRLLDGAPLAAHRLRRRLLYGGSLLLFLVAGLGVMGFYFPATIPYVGFFAVVLVILFVAMMALVVSRRINRAALRFGVDLDTYAQLPADERRVLLVRRIGLHVLDSERMGNAVEHIMGHAEPEANEQDADPVPSPPPAAPGLSLQVAEEEQLPPPRGHAREERVPPVVPVPDFGAELAAEERPGRGERFMRFAQRVIRSAAESAEELDTAARRGREEGSREEQEVPAAAAAESAPRRRRPAKRPRKAARKTARKSARGGAKRVGKKRGALSTAQRAPPSRAKPKKTATPKKAAKRAPVKKRRQTAARKATAKKGARKRRRSG